MDRPDLIALAVGIVIGLVLQALFAACWRSPYAKEARRRRAERRRARHHGRRRSSRLHTGGDREA